MTQSNIWRMHDLESINILLIGESRSGKSTFLKMFKNIETPADDIKLFSQTKNPQIVELISNNRPKVIRFIDTPGYNDTSSIDRPDYAISSLIFQTCKSTIPKIHMILITINGSSGVQQSKIESLFEMVDLFDKSAYDLMTILVTHADQFDRDNWKSQFLDNDETRILSEHCGNRFLFSGLLNNHYNNVETQTRTFQEIYDIDPLRCEVIKTNVDQSLLSLIRISETLYESIPGLKERMKYYRSRLQTLTKLSNAEQKEFPQVSIMEAEIQLITTTLNNSKVAQFPCKKYEAELDKIIMEVNKRIKDIRMMRISKK